MFLSWRPDRTASRCLVPDSVAGHSNRFRLGTSLNWSLVWFALMASLMPASDSFAAPGRPATEPSIKARAAVQTKAKPKVKAKLKAPKARAAIAKPQVKPARPVPIETSLPEVERVATKDGDFDGEAATARQAVADNPGDTKGRERLARITAVLVDALLHADALGDTGKAGELMQTLSTRLHDTGWRVQKMAQSGDLMARQATGFLLERGVLLEKDVNRSCVEFFIAAEQLAAAGWHAAQCLMKAAPDRAWIQMERAAVRGHAIAQEWMGRRCLGEFGRIDSDYVCARSWLAQSASQGRPRSQTLLAYLLMNGHGGTVDEPRAARLYRLAADQGDADAQNNLGEMQEMGRGIPPSPEDALRWYQSAAERGLAPAQYNAGRLLAIGTGGKRDPVKARAFLLQADGNGIAQARQVLNWLDRQNAPDSSESAVSGTAIVPPGESKSE